MYTKIDTDDCIARLSEFLLRPDIRRSYQYPPEALLEALEIVMRNNVMRFGDVIVRQLVGIAMGMSPAPTISNLYIAIYERSNLLQFVGDSIFFLRRLSTMDLGYGCMIQTQKLMKPTGYPSRQL